MCLFKRVFLVVSLILALIACKKESKKPDKPEVKCLQVRASAYNSVSWQTKEGKTNITAWGDTLKPGMKAIAVSRDLIDSGLIYNQKVFIEGLEGAYFVKDKMNSRWKRKIDVYMGKDIKSARLWGVKKVAVRWETDQKR